MPTASANVVVLIVSYNNRGDLPGCLRAVLDSDDGDIVRDVVVVDNASSDGSADFVAAQFPQVELVRNDENLGFTGGNNLGWQHIRRLYPQTQYLALLNPDTVVHSGWLRPLVDYLEQHRDVGAVQPKIVLHGRTDAAGWPLINTVGNRSHYLGFGFVTGFEQPDTGQYDSPRSIDFASGAAVVLRGDLLDEYGLFDESFFMYLEDADLGWKLRLLGYDSVCVPDSVIEHKHDPEKTLGHYYRLEINRWMLIFSYYKWRTLLLIGPMIDFMELGTFFFAWRQGRLRDKWRVYRDFFFSRGKGRDGWSEFVERRRWIQEHRVVSDRQLMTRFAGRIDFPPINRGLLRYLANPILAAWWWVARRLIFW